MKHIISSIKFGIMMVVVALMASQMATTYAKEVKPDEHDAEIKAAINQHDNDVKADIATHDGKMTTEHGALSTDHGALSTDHGALSTEHSDLDTKLDQILAACKNGGTTVGVPKTGQTTSYETGDDGDLQRGVAWPNPRFTDNGDETVTDNLTGLIWTKDANLFGARTWSQALTDCNTLADSSIANGPTDGSAAGDWHLANRFELESLLHMGVFNPAVPDTLGTGHWSQGDPFNNVQTAGGIYWSSTTLAHASHIAWTVVFHLGAVHRHVSEKAQRIRFVWCVRGGQ